MTSTTDESPSNDPPQPPPPPPPPPFGSLAPPPPPPLARLTSNKSEPPNNNIPSKMPPPPPPPAPCLNNIKCEDETDRSMPFILETNFAKPQTEGRKTMKLHWKNLSGGNLKQTVWDDLPAISLDETYYENLFEVKERARKRSHSKTVKPIKAVHVLDNKRTNSICIAMKKLPPLSLLQDAIIEMNENIVDREGIEKIQQLLPSEEELKQINEQKELNKELPLGEAEQFLLLLSTVPNIDARLKLWAFKSDFKSMEKEIYEPLKDLKLGMEALKTNKTFHTILGVTLAIGNVLNKKKSKGFHLDYLAKLNGVKDTIQKKSLMYHVTSKVLETYPSCSDFYFEVESLSRVSRTNYSELQADLTTMTEQCNNSINYVKQASKAGTDTEEIVKNFLHDASKRIEALKKVEKQISKKYTNFLLWLGIPSHFHSEYPAHVVAKIITDLAFNFKVQLTQIKESTERMKTVKAKKIQRKSAPSLSCVSNNEKDERTDLEQFLNTAMTENGRKTREPSPMMWSSR